MRRAEHRCVGPQLARQVFIGRHAEDQDGRETHDQRQQLRGERVGVLEHRGVGLGGNGRVERVLPGDLAELQEQTTADAKHRLQQGCRDQRAHALEPEQRDRPLQALHGIGLQAIEGAVRQSQQTAGQRRVGGDDECELAARHVVIVHRLHELGQQQRAARRIVGSIHDVEQRLADRGGGRLVTGVPARCGGPGAGCGGCGGRTGAPGAGRRCERCAEGQCLQCLHRRETRVAQLVGLCCGTRARRRRCGSARGLRRARARRLCRGAWMRAVMRAGDTRDDGDGHNGPPPRQRAPPRAASPS